MDPLTKQALWNSMPAILVTIGLLVALAVAFVWAAKRDTNQTEKACAALIRMASQLRRAANAGDKESFRALTTVATHLDLVVPELTSCPRDQTIIVLGKFANEVVKVLTEEKEPRRPG